MQENLRSCGFVRPFWVFPFFKVSVDFLIEDDVLCFFASYFFMCRIKRNAP